jgi:DNA-binding CsgD family transcriptional regulator
MENMGIALENKSHVSAGTVIEDSTDEGRAVTSAMHRDSKALDYLIVIIGFGLCRAWIVFCLATPIVLGGSSVFNWLYLVIGSLTALAVAFLVKSIRFSVSNFRRELYRLTAVLLLLSAIAMPPAIIWKIELLVYAGVVVGGGGAGLLQVLWGEQFAKHATGFAAVVSPAAAILTAVIVALSTTGIAAESSLVGYFFLPLVSFALLLYKAERFGLKLSQLFGFQKQAKDPASDRKDVVAANGDKAAGLDGTAAIGEGALVANAPGSEDERDKVMPSEKNCVARPLGAQFVKLMFSIMVFAILCRIFDILPHEGPDFFGFFGGSALFSLVVVGAIFLVFIIVLKKHFDPILTYRMSLPIMITGFVAIAMFFETQASLCILLINVGYEFFDILTWVLFTEMVRRKAVHPLRVFGFGVAFMFTGMALGYLIGNILSSSISGGSLQITIVALFCTLSLAVVAFLVLPEGAMGQFVAGGRSDKKDGDVSTSEDQEGSFIINEEGVEEFIATNDGVEKSFADGGSAKHLEANCSLVAEAYHLTPREKEVLVLLAYGRTGVIIARTLTISGGTARTHKEKIYRKLGVHKQQELIDLVEGFDLKVKEEAPFAR